MFPAIRISGPARELSLRQVLHSIFWVFCSGFFQFWLILGKTGI